MLKCDRWGRMAVVLAFFVCWAPYHSQRLLFLYVSLYGEWTEALRKVNQDLFSLAGCFYYFNSTINPILYSVMSNRFRVAFREKLCAGHSCRRRWRVYALAHQCSASPSRRPEPALSSLDQDRPRLSSDPGFEPRCSGTSDSDYHLAREKRSSECVSANFANFDSCIPRGKTPATGEDSPTQAETKM
ncbi:Neuropeptides capa receptor [Araneus ventricosus]|uniref:Neuropeptides capa receptor n=1 Tax=Araneus ventricosus TaxID=182803 RepID=A0A4Y2Q884_ARAVE|nr:Neuropeptides capa receptor [Araneus ventricosus]